MPRGRPGPQRSARFPSWVKTMRPSCAPSRRSTMRPVRGRRSRPRGRINGRIRPSRGRDGAEALGGVAPHSRPSGQASDLGEVRSAQKARRKWPGSKPGQAPPGPGLVHCPLAEDHVVPPPRALGRRRRPPPRHEVCWRPRGLQHALPLGPVGPMSTSTARTRRDPLGCPARMKPRIRYEHQASKSSSAWHGGIHRHVPIRSPGMRGTWTGVTCRVLSRRRPGGAVPPAWASR